MPAERSDAHRTEPALKRIDELASIHAHLRARHVSESTEMYVTLAGRVVRVRLVGIALARIFEAAFGHLSVAPAAPSLTIDVWDDEVSDVTADGAGDEDFGQTWLVGGGLLTTALRGRVIRHQLPHTTAWFDRATSSIVGSVSSTQELSLYERGKPLHYLLSLWHNDTGVFVTHGALVARDGRGVLLAGVGGSGKSTTAATCLAAGFDYLGDDCIGMERRPDSSFVGHSVFAAPWLDRHALNRLPAFAAGAREGTSPGEDKALVNVSNFVPRGRLTASAAIVAIGLPRIVAKAETIVSRCSLGDALRALGPSSILLFAPSPGAEGLRHLRALVSSAPCFWLDLGQDVSRIPAAIDDMLRLTASAALTDQQTRDRGEPVS